jgi:chaperonin GroEL (HSP60 family)
MNPGEWAAVLGAAGSVLGGGGWFVARATRDAARVTADAQRATAAAAEAAARANAAPAQQAADLAVLQATVKRVDEENGQLRGRQARFESMLRAFSWTVDRWARQMHRAGIEPEPVHPLVDEYNRTGV